MTKSYCDRCKKETEEISKWGMLGIDDEVDLDLFYDLCESCAETAGRFVDEYQPLTKQCKKVIQLSGTIKNGAYFVKDYFDWEGDWLRTGPLMNRISINNALYKEYTSGNMIYTPYKNKSFNIGDTLLISLDREKKRIQIRKIAVDKGIGRHIYERKEK